VTENGLKGQLKPVDQDRRASRDKLYAATRTLAAGTGPLKARLRSAFTPDLLALQPEQFPWPDLAERWSAVINELAPNGRPIVTLEQWWDFELVRIVEEIVDIYDQVGRRLDDG
jgi:hypothetical protein